MSELTNFYTLPGVKAFNAPSDNPEYGNKHFINIPGRILLCGSSGSMKTNTLMNMIKAMPGTFDHVILCCKSSHEPLYQWLIKKLGNSIDVYEDGDIPDLNSLENIEPCGYKKKNVKSPNAENKKAQILCIFDDLINDKRANEVIAEYYIRSRKVAGGCTCIYLSQNYYSIPKTIRSNSNILMLKKLSSTKDLNLILRENNLANIDIKTFRKLYKDCTEKKENIMMIDIDGNKIYRNFNKDITPASTEE